MMDREAWEAEKIANAQGFCAFLHHGRGNRERGPIRPTIEEAEADGLEMMERSSSGRRAMIYAISHESYTIHIKNL